MKAVNSVGEKECTLALNFGGGAESEDNVPARIYEQPLLLQPDPATLILEAHISSIADSQKFSEYLSESIKLNYALFVGGIYSKNLL